MELSRAEYLRFAEECRKLARLALTMEEKVFLWEREASWTKLAKEAGRTTATSVIKSA
ncbi:MAG TPA: hypothetical protein VH678_04635 [Xanthobacteraceae bacterium]|jgi:hypothetical protein